eukprot:gb/GECG01002854.1/.p1 GENE.gb/GECG01002854.1/~~gb/GECG01002854.1/.p1  ORF type:complete len:1039 (+),score=167.11 gb/GECG01002854.1/:1-3117(+)
MYRTALNTASKFLTGSWTTSFSPLHVCSRRSQESIWRPFLGVLYSTRAPIKMQDPPRTREWSVSEVRNQFISFFRDEKSHTYYKSSPVVPHDDPTLLFANAGMNQFKPIFLGRVDPKSPLAGLNAACNSQKCIRAGGKHNDLEDVGKDVYHHTFFEMLGSWSFANYFKKEAIDWSWELLTSVYGLDGNRLYATYFSGDEEMGIGPDEEARNYWREYLPDERILPGDKKDNFWEMGDTGPCGPCSELHYDRVGDRDAAHLVNADVPDVLEIWNLVFMQYFKDEQGNLSRLPHNHVDTGMGLERLVSILQDKPSNYDTDVFQPIFQRISELTNTSPYGGRVGEEDVDGRDTAYRVVADHIRSLCFAITDGAVPSNEGRGYVLRRILRRAVRFGNQKLKAPSGFLSKLVPTVVHLFQDAFPELEQRENFVREIIDDEESSFERTLSRGLKRFREMVERMKQSGETVVKGKDAFFLYDSMGFPLDLTRLMAEEEGLSIDEEGFDEEMRQQKIRSSVKKGKEGEGKMLTLEAEQTAKLAEQGVPPTDDDEKYNWYTETPAIVKAIWTGEKFLSETEGGSSKHGMVGLVLDRTAFYAEAGGQEYDTGDIIKIDPEQEDPDENQGVLAKLDVENVQSFGGYILHMGRVEEGEIRVGDSIKCRVDYERRSRIAPNHTMTHILNFALRKVLGDNIDQKGSLVAEDRLRFDFNHSSALTEEQIDRIEGICNELIDEAKPVYSKVVSLGKARAIHSLRAVFGETYPDPVRVISVGQPVEPMVEDPERPDWSSVSVEFCGGTHLKNTSQAGKFALVEEGSIAKGIRRVVCFTREAAEKAHDAAEELRTKFRDAKSLPLREREERLKELSTELNQKDIPISQKMKLRNEEKEISKQIVQEKKAAFAERINAASSKVVEAAKEAESKGKSGIVLQLDELDADNKTVKDINKALSKNDVTKSDSGKVAVLGVSGVRGEHGKPGRFLMFSMVPKPVGESLSVDPIQWINKTLEASGLDGKPRGKGSEATVAGKLEDPAQLDKAIAEAKSVIGAE